MQNRLQELDRRLRAVAPIDGIAIGAWDDRETWRVDYAETATQSQRAAGAAVVDDFVFARPIANEVRAEARRRMRVMLGARDDTHLEMLITNGLREGTRLLKKGPETWTADEAARAASLAAVDAAIEAIRARSNAMEPAPPDDYEADAHWPGPGFSIDQIKSFARDAVNAAAERAASLGSPYLARENEVAVETALRAASGHTPSNDMLAAEASALGQDPVAYRDGLILARANDQARLLAVRMQRLQGLAAIAAAGSPEQIAAARDAALIAIGA